MKCRNCDREAVYDDGLCDACHRAAEQERARIMSDRERDSFRGQTIEEDGTVRDEKSVYEEQSARQQAQSGIHFYTAGLSWRVKLALGFIIFCVLSIIVSALGFLIMAMPYLLGALVIYFVYNILKALFHR
ncbi:hypothetical protein [Megasphaera cerevisiae]|uniref:hypothetical protein n=1 Tax=Megasphaera cerevisiae TaxID=39029 RepID=UPI0009420162|nr:hypothetical protein [Megasphaera cerevisiae]OKY53193.1 hypothetical protein BSR42_09025 [Megasphaera cerevisiae]